MYRILLVLILTGTFAHAQEFTLQDTLRGSVTPERAWWDLTHYDLDITIDPEKKFIYGTNTITYRVLEGGMNRMQIDLQPPMKITGVRQDGKDLKVASVGNAHFINLSGRQKKGAVRQVEVDYEGNPREAVQAPWDGGFSWKQDRNGNPFVATSCQGLGASAWWPNKDHMYDEVDSMRMKITVPSGLTGVGNGRLVRQEEKEGKTTYTWKVENPINNYGVNVNIADYVSFRDTYEGEQGTLDLVYYVLPYNLEKARTQFKDVNRMLEAFEHWFGPYPFYEDSFKLVEVPYLGMEHQSSVTYGNQYKNGYLGSDLSGTGWGLKFDFIIIHEAGHEWFANNITYKDIADMWIHEGFTHYSESLFLEYHYGKEAASEYVRGVRSRIQNDRPIIGTYGVNHEGSSDMYYKGANILHTLRQLLEDDALWRDILRGMNEEFRHQTVTTQEIETYLSKRSGKDLSAFFDQYLRTTKVPVVEYAVVQGQLKFRYTNVIENFDMPVRMFVNEKPVWIFPEPYWKKVDLPARDATVQPDPDFYVKFEQVAEAK